MTASQLLVRVKHPKSEGHVTSNEDEYQKICPVKIYIYKQCWTLASKISRGSRPSKPRRIDAYGHGVS